EGDQRARAVERNRLPVALAALLAELLRGQRERPATTAADPGQPSGPGLLEEALQVDHTLSHGRTGSPRRSRCCRPAYGSGRPGRPRPVAGRPRREAG